MLRAHRQLPLRRSTTTSSAARCSPPIEGEFVDDFSRALDEAWKARLGGKKLYVNDLFLTLVRRPMAAVRLDRPGWCAACPGVKNDAEATVARAQDKRELDAAREALISALAPYGARAADRLRRRQGPCSEPLEFLSALYNGEMRPVLLPQSDLGQYLPYRRVSFGAEALELSRSRPLPRSFAAMISVKDYPPQSAAGMLDDLLRLPHELVVTQSFAFVDRQHSLDRMNLALRRMRAADDEADEPARRPDPGQGRRGRRPRRLRRAPPHRHGQGRHPRRR